MERLLLENEFTTGKKKVSDEKMVRARSLFSKYDLDGSGNIDRDELEKIFEEVNYKPSNEIMCQLDPDGSGTISFMEFVNAFDIWDGILKNDSKRMDEPHKAGPKVTLSQQQMAKARETFSKYDSDGDGTISSKELFDILKGLLLSLHSEYESEKQATYLMSIIDADGDGNITFIEFLKGYEQWIQLEEANNLKKQIEKEMESIKNKMEVISKKKKEIGKYSNKLEEEFDRLQAQLETETASRVKLERELCHLWSEDETIEESKVHAELRQAYDDLNHLSLLDLTSREFYTRMQFFISTSTIKNM